MPVDQDRPTLPSPPPFALYPEPPFPDPSQSPRVTLPRLATIAAVVAVLYLGKEVLLPLAIAMLLTFALSPLVTLFRKRGLPMTASVLIVVFLASGMMAVFSLVVASQLSSLARDLPRFQDNILIKLETLKEQGGEGSLIARITDMAGAINAEIGAAIPAEPAGTPAAETPIPVEVVERLSPLDTLTSLVMPLISPVATTGLVVVVVIFMLLEREELRDRFIRLIGAHDLHRTTAMLEEAGSRVGRYLLVQLLVNIIYALPIGVGLWLIGVPNAVLWGLLTLVLRFVPYIGSILSAAFPLFLAFAVSREWSAVLWTAALFIAVETVTSNLIEPWLYGSRTGVSPLAIIISAILWTWIWGPLGLVMSTPLTVCLVVLGRHVPQFELFGILFGDEPVLEPHAHLYQRWLAGDAVESTYRAEEALEEEYLSDYYRNTALPALLLAQTDWSRGVLSTVQETRLAVTALQMVQDLRPYVAEERDENRPDATEAPVVAPGRVVVLGGRGALDDVAAAILAQVLAVEGAEAEAHGHADLAPARLAHLDLPDCRCVILNFLDPSPPRSALLHVRRLKRNHPHLRVGVVIWSLPESTQTGENVAWGLRADAGKLAEAEAIGADFAVTWLEPALLGAVSSEPPRPLPPRDTKLARSLTRRKGGADPAPQG